MKLSPTRPRPCIIDVLRGDRQSRPPIDTSSAAGLRAVLEDGIYATVSDTPIDTPIVVRASSLREAPRTTNLIDSPLARIRGVLIAQLLRLRSVNEPTGDPYDDAVAAWRAETNSPGLFADFARLEPDDLARLRSDVRAHAHTLHAALGPIPRQWMVRTNLRVSQRLSAGRVVAHDVLDLLIGETGPEQSSVALLDLTSAPLAEGAERVLRYHALVQTLRTSVAPLRSAVFSSATGELWSLDVTNELLMRGAGELLDAIESLWRSRSTTPP